MGLQSVLKIRAKTSKLFALQASPCKGSKPRADLEQFIFSMIISVAGIYLLGKYSLSGSRSASVST
jgi:hypothetical protein